MKIILLFRSSLRRAALQLQAGDQEEGFSNEGYGSGAKVTVCLTDVRMYLVDPRG